MGNKIPSGNHVWSADGSDQPYVRGSRAGRAVRCHRALINPKAPAVRMTADGVHIALGWPSPIPLELYVF